MTYKKILMAIMCLTAVFAFSSCKQDDEIDINKEAAKLKENQILLDGKIQDVTCALGIRPAGKGWEGDPGAYYVDIMPVDQSLTWHGRYDLGLPLIGKTINLADPEKALDGCQFSMYFEQGDDYLNMNNMFGLEGGRGILEDKELSGSCFKSGTFKTSHDKKDGFHLTFSGVLVNEKPIALKAYLPEADVQYW